MPFLLLAVGAVLLASALQGTVSDLATQLKSDFSGSNSFLYWIAAIGIVGMIGYVPTLERPARAFLALVILAFLLANGGGFFAQLFATIQAPPQPVSPAGGSNGAGNPSAANPNAGQPATPDGPLTIPFLPSFGGT